MLQIFLIFMASWSFCNIDSKSSNAYLANKQNSATTKVNYIKTFKIAHCDKIKLQYYKKMSDSRDGIEPATAEITDKVTLDKICALLSKLPDTGDIMKKPGDVSHLKVYITINDAETVCFSYYGSTLKTTDTSFYSNHPNEEKKLYELLMKKLKN